MTPAERVELLRARLAADGQVTVETHGHSMWPALQHGRFVTVFPVADTPLGIGDVVLAFNGRRLVMHRVIAIAPGRVLLKGDANPADDGWCSTDDVIARLPPRRDDALRAAISRHAGPPVARIVGLCRRVAARVSACR